MASHSESNKAFTKEEQDLDGSSRLGEWLPDKTIFPFPDPPASDTVKYDVFAGDKRYELTNHLGNVMGVITDRKIPKETGTPDSIAEYYIADIANIQDYYPFGMTMPGRDTISFPLHDYRFIFNGKEGDNETFSRNNEINYGKRIYYPRLGKFINIDPIFKSFPWYSPYAFAGNKPIVAIDIDGLEEYIVNYIYNDNKELIAIDVLTFKNIKGESRDMKIHESNSNINPDNKNVMVIYTNEDGTPIKDPTYQDQLTKSQSEILKRKLTDKSHKLTEHSERSIQGTDFGGWTSIYFNSGFMLVARLNTIYTIDVKYNENSNTFIAGEDVKSMLFELAEAADIMKDEATIQLNGNTGVDPGTTEPLGHNQNVLNSPAILNGQPTDTRHLMQARANAVKNVLINDYNIPSDHVISQSGSQRIGDSGRNVDGKLLLPDNLNK